jgi:hypothetical protein
MAFQPTSHLFRDMSLLTNRDFVSFALFSLVLHTTFSFVMILPLPSSNVNFVLDLDGKWGMRIESALVVRKVRVSWRVQSILGRRGYANVPLFRREANLTAIYGLASSVSHVFLSKHVW